MNQKITLTLTPSIDLTKPPNADLQIEGCDEFTACRSMLRVTSQLLDQLAEHAAQARMQAQMQQAGTLAAKH